MTHISPNHFANYKAHRAGHARDKAESGTNRPLATWDHREDRKLLSERRKDVGLEPSPCLVYPFILGNSLRQLCSRLSIEGGAVMFGGRHSKGRDGHG